MSPNPYSIDAPELAGLFDSGWAEQWCSEITSAGGWRRTSGGWSGTLVFEATDLPGAVETGTRAVLLDLDGESCRAARTATATDVEAADYRFSARAEHWLQLLSGELDPVWAMLAGKLRLVTGASAKATPGQQAAREIVRAARRVAERYMESREA